MEKFEEQFSDLDVRTTVWACFSYFLVQIGRTVSDHG